MVMHSRNARASSSRVSYIRLEDDINPHEITGKYLEPKDFYENETRRYSYHCMHEMIMNLI